MLNAQQRIIFYFILLSISILGGGIFVLFQWVYPPTNYETRSTHLNRQLMLVALIGFYLLVGIVWSYLGRKKAFVGGERKGFFYGAIICSVVALIGLIYVFLFYQF